MKTFRLLLLFCLAMTIGAQAQFGRLGDLAKKTQKKPNTAVQRANSGTFEATTDIKNIMGGETKEVTVTIKNRDAHDFEIGDETESCLKVTDVKAVSDTQIKMKVYAATSASDGNCRIELKNKQGESAYAEMKVKHKPQPGENFRPEEVSLAKAFPSAWVIRLPDGGTETLTRGKQTPSGGYEYKDSKGKWYQAMYMSMQLMLGGAYGNQCAYMAQLNNSGEGIFMPLSNACGYAIGARMYANAK